MVVLVTGGGSGMGRAVAQLTAGEGAAAVVVGDVDEAGAEATAELIKDGADVLAHAVDVSDPDAVDDLVRTTVERFGRLDMAVNCAGVSGPNQAIADLGNDTWRQVVSINMDGIFYSLRAEINAMRPHQQGAIVNIASAAAIDPIPNMSAYSASKMGVVGLTRVAAGELVREGIRVNAILPGAIRTPMWEKHGETEEGRKHIEGRLSMGHPGTPMDVAEAAMWLCCADSSYVTGISMLVDGGAHAYRV